MSERRFDDSPRPRTRRAFAKTWQGDTPPAPDAALDAACAPQSESSWRPAREPATTGATVIRPRAGSGCAFTLTGRHGAVVLRRDQGDVPDRGGAAADDARARSSAAVSAPMQPENDAVQGAAPSTRACACQTVGSPDRRRTRRRQRRNSCGTTPERRAPAARPQAWTHSARSADVHWLPVLRLPVAADAAPADAAPRNPRSAPCATRRRPRSCTSVPRRSRAQAPEASSAQRADPAPRTSERPAAAWCASARSSVAASVSRHGARSRNG